MKKYSILSIAATLLFAAMAHAQTVDTTPSRVRYTGTGANDNDLLFTASGTDGFTVCMLQSIAGAVDVEVRLGPDEPDNWTTAALSLQDLGATDIAPVLVTVADRMFAVVGKYEGIRVRQNGGTAATAFLYCYNSGTGMRQ
jgi:hypothetical protein